MCVCVSVCVLVFVLEVEYVCLVNDIIGLWQALRKHEPMLSSSGWRLSSACNIFTFKERALSHQSSVARKAFQKNQHFVKPKKFSTLMLRITTSQQTDRRTDRQSNGA